MIYLLKICSLLINRHTSHSGVRFIHLQSDFSSLAAKRDTLWTVAERVWVACIILPFRLISAFQKAFDYLEKSVLVVYEASVLAFGRAITTDGVSCLRSQGSAASCVMRKYHTVQLAVWQYDFCYIWKDILEKWSFLQSNITFLT